MEKTVVVAIGGNAITQNNQKGTLEEQFANVAMVCDSIIHLIQKGYHVVLTHGNGPQVGNLLIKNEAGKPIVPEHTLDVCAGRRLLEVLDIFWNSPFKTDCQSLE